MTDKIKGCMALVVNSSGEVIVSGTNFDKKPSYGNVEDHQRREAEQEMYRNFLKKYMLSFLMEGFATDYDMCRFAERVIERGDFKVRIVWIGDEEY